MKKKLYLGLGVLFFGIGAFTSVAMLQRDPSAPFEITKFLVKKKESLIGSNAVGQEASPESKATFQSLVKQFQSVTMTDKEFNALPSEMKHHPTGKIKDVITALAEIYGQAAQNPNLQKQAQIFYSNCVKDTSHSIFIRRMCEAHGASLFESWQPTALNEFVGK